MKLKYIGRSFIPGIPARDLTEEEVKRYGGEKYLTGTGLWTAYKASNKKTDGKTSKVK